MNQFQKAPANHLRLMLENSPRLNQCPVFQAYWDFWAFLLDPWKGVGSYHVEILRTQADDTCRALILRNLRVWNCAIHDSVWAGETTLDQTGDETERILQQEFQLLMEFMHEGKIADSKDVKTIPIVFRTNETGISLFFLSQFNLIRKRQVFNHLSKLPFDDTSVLVDTYRYQLLSRFGHTHSNQIINAISAIKPTKKIPLNDLTLKCYGINYDPLIHREKVFTLLRRLKQLTHLKLKVRQGWLIREGEWDNVIFLSNSIWHQNLQNLFHSDSYQIKPIEDANRLKSSAFLISKLKTKETFIRQDVQNIGNLSKSTAQRLINSWSRQHLIEKANNGKKTLYRFLKDR